MIENKTLAAALAGADENSLIALANKGLYKRACKDTEGLTAEYTEAEASAVVSVGGERCIIRVPLEKSSCTCPSRTVCRHILGAVLLLKREVPEDVQPAPEPAAEAVPEAAAEPVPDRPLLLSEKDAEAVRECVRQSLKLLGGLLARGLIRADASAADELELAAVRAHAAGMADAERLLRALCTKLSECTERKASFDAAYFTRLLCECAGLLRSLDKPEISEAELGTFRAEYEPYPGTLVLLPVGHREQRGGAYEGDVYYFLNMDENAPERFLVYSDLRPVFYGGSRKRFPAASVWGLGSSLMSMMKSRMTLEGAKLCGNKLSGSNSTQVVSSGKAEINCPQLRKLIVCDYRDLIRGLENADERLFLIRIEQLADCGFNKYTQQFGMTVQDIGGRRAEIRVKYRPEEKRFIEKLEEISGRIKNEQGMWTALVNARMSEGRVVLDPIEFYCGIVHVDRNAPAPDDFADPGEAVYAGRLLAVISELEDSLVRAVRSGLGSVQEDHTQLLDALRRTGMTSLTKLAEEGFSAADSYRHYIEDGGEDALLKMSGIMRYTVTAKKKLGLITAENAMTAYTPGTPA